jgi:hypothetical protein
MAPGGAGGISALGAPSYDAYGNPTGNPLVNAIKARVFGQQAMGTGGPMGPDGRPMPPGYEPPTPVPLPEDTGDQNQGAIIAAILGGSALLGIVAGCALFRNKGGPEGDSDSDADSHDDSEDSDD